MEISEKVKYILHMSWYWKILDEQRIGERKGKKGENCKILG